MTWRLAIMNILEKMTLLALGICSVGSLTACGDNAANRPIGTPDSTGQVGISLRVPDGTTIQSATYTITGPLGFSRTGTIQASSSTMLSALIEGIPAGTGYQVSLMATTADSSASCTGSASFDVVARLTATVTVPMTCIEAPRAGSVLVNGKLNICPSIDGIGANPAEVEVGGTIALTAAAHDSDAGPSPLSFGWTTTSGTLSDPTARNPTFTCTTPGTATVRLTVSDGDPAASCADTSVAQVTCSVAPRTPGPYVAGDFHNHTTCSDGSISMQKLVKKATDRVDTPWGLDWFVQAGHGGNGNRNCTLVEDATLTTPAYPFVAGLGPNTSWENSGVTPKGDVSGTSPNRNMWRWQSIQEFQYPLIEYLNALKNLPLFLGIESVVPGHEHSSMSIITGQIPAGLDAQALPAGPPYTPLGNGNALAQWEYCFDRGDGDTSRGAANQWDCSVPGSLNAADPSWNATAQKLVPAGGPGNGTLGHLKTLEALKWMASFHPDAAYYVPAHLERAGQFNPDGNNGYNVEHLRDFNNAAPRIAFGFETQPGHGASANRGEYQVKRNNIGGVLTDSVGGTTYGGTGVYGAQIGGVWDALLGEGRAWWFFASSDWHNRGSFGPDDRRTTGDFYPGEYQRTYTLARSGGNKPRPQTIVDGLRSGNNFSTSGQIIDRLAFVVCTSRAEALVAELVANAAVSNTTLDAAGCATMGEKLVVPAGADVIVGIAVRDPAGANFSPYTFANPSLLQVGITQPINMPVLDHVDLIGGMVTGLRTPGTAGYAGEWPRNTSWLRADGTTADLSVVPDAAKNVTTAVLHTFSGAGASPWTPVTSQFDTSTFLTMTFRIPAVAASQYVRLRGTNLPPAVPFETDADGNPLADLFTNANDQTMLRIPCTTAHSANSQFDGCPDHLAPATGTSPIAGQRAVSFDVAAWTDLWFYSNPIYIEVTGAAPVAGLVRPRLAAR
ncbi:MAG TPA: PKD domain-containing protein [Kofleriaceae bacterium]|nr:PKD domain-containing protein [Kofleriaceae bacterium]